MSKKASHEMAFVETSVALPLLYGYALWGGIKELCAASLLALVAALVAG